MEPSGSTPLNLKATRWTERELFQAVDDWVKIHGKLPDSLTWNKSSAKKPKHPSFQTIWTRYGSLENFLLRYKRHQRRWDQEKIISALKEWYEIHGRAPTASDLRTVKGIWMPSHDTVAKHFDSWGDALEAAGFEQLPFGVSRKSFDKFKPIPRKDTQ